MRTVLFLVTVVVMMTIVHFASCKPALSFNKGGSFKIVQFTDLHFGNDDSLSDNLTMEAQSVILDVESPDFVIVSGDSTSSWKYPNLHWGSCMGITRGVLHCHNDSVLAMTQRKIPWAFTFGNHDRESPIFSGERILQHEMSLPYSLTEEGPKEISGLTNYVLHVKGLRTGAKGLDLWFLDTRDKISWYQNSTRERISRGIGSPYGLMTIHIPPPEMVTMANTDIEQPCLFGLFNETICCPKFNTGFFDSLIKMGNVQTLIFGHDHNNDFYGKYSGMTMMYGRKSGYGCYGPEKPLVVGARVIEYREIVQPNGDITYTMDTWIRNFDGEREVQSHLVHLRPIQPECGGSRR